MTTGEDFAQELAKRLPVEAVYKDAVSPAAKQFGQLAEDLIKVLQLALAPVQAVAALQDRYRSFIDASIRRVPSERQIAPPPQILGPVIEGVRYEPEGTPIDKMYSRLLSCSMDSERADMAHPAYPFIIRQLSADEAQVLETIYNAEKYIERVVRLGRGSGFAVGIEKDEFPRSNLTFPKNLQFYVSHLQQLGLAELRERKREPLYPDDAKAGSFHQTGVRVFSRYQLTEMGERFLEACHGQ